MNRFIGRRSTAFQECTGRKVSRTFRKCAPIRVAAKEAPTSAVNATGSPGVIFLSGSCRNPISTQMITPVRQFTMHKANATDSNPYTSKSVISIQQPWSFCDQSGRPQEAPYLTDQGTRYPPRVRQVVTRSYRAQRTRKDPQRPSMNFLRPEKVIVFAD